MTDPTYVFLQVKNQRPSDGDTITYSSATGEWAPAAGGGGGGASNIDGGNASSVGSALTAIDGGNA